MAGATSNLGNLEEEALKRRERLKKLKRIREVNNSSNEIGNELDCLPKPIFRSYKPVNSELSEFVLDPSTPGDIAKEVTDHLESAKSELVIDQLDVTSLAPRKPDWDLKRDVASKLTKLERQTQRAIAELIWERLKEKKADDLASIVNIGTSDSIS